jgi:hypothetical protein
MRRLLLPALLVAVVLAGFFALRPHSATPPPTASAPKPAATAPAPSDAAVYADTAPQTADADPQPAVSAKADANPASASKPATKAAAVSPATTKPAAASTPTVKPKASTPTRRVHAAPVSRKVVAAQPTLSVLHPQKKTTDFVTATVVTVKGDKLTVETSSGAQRSYSLAGAKVAAGGKLADRSALRAGQTVTVSVTGDGSVMAVTVA